MNIRKLIGMLLLMPVGICMAQDKFSIAGKLTGEDNDRMVVLSYVNSEGKNAKDSALVKKGKFVINGTTAYGNKAYLSLMPVKTDSTKKRTQADYQTFYLEKGNYKVVIADSISKATITGTKSQSDYLEFNAKTDALLTKWRQITQRFQKAMSKKDSLEMKDIQAEAKPLHAKLEAALDSFIYSHPDSYVSLDLVAENKTSVIEPETFDPFYKALSPRVLNSFTGKRITDKYEKVKQTFVGKAFDFTQDDVAGKPFKLSSLRGKYVLVDFWASWCGPCRAENPNLLKAYQKLKDKNFEIVSISLDDNKTAWLKAVEKDALPWKQVSDLKGWKNEVAITYGVTAVPQNLLINPEGVIVAKNLRGEGLTEKLTAVMK
jgi:thiol-disulfide isomerase/thioredoxin